MTGTEKTRRKGKRTKEGLKVEEEKKNQEEKRKKKKKERRDARSRKLQHYATTLARAIR